MRAKLGIFNAEAEAGDESLIEGLLRLMQQHGADYTNTFRALTFDQDEETAMSESTAFAEWQQLWQARLGRQQESETAARQLMQDSNPAVIPRNHRVEEALEAAVEREDFSVMKRLLEVLSNPYAHSPAQADYATPPAPSSRPYRTFCGT